MRCDFTMFAATA